MHADDKPREVITGQVPATDDEPEIEDSAWQRAGDSVIVAGSPSVNEPAVLPDIEHTAAAAVQAKGSEDLLLVPLNCIDIFCREYRTLALSYLPCSRWGYGGIRDLCSYG